MRRVSADAAGLSESVAALHRGEVVAYPTETVYGLGVDPLSNAALDRLYAVKRRDPDHPVLIVIGAIEQLDELVQAVPASAQKCIEAFWPGPLSLLFPRAQSVPERLANPAGRICVRWSSHPIAAQLAREFGRGITSTSANRSGAPPALSAEEVPQPGVSVCIDGGPCGGSTVSTVYDSETDRILREGAISHAALDAALGNS